MYGGAADLVPRKLGIPHACQFGYDAGTHQIERAMVPGCAEAYQGVTLEFENWYPIADNLNRAMCCGLDDPAKPLECDPHIIW